VKCGVTPEKNTTRKLSVLTVVSNCLPIECQLSFSTCFKTAGFRSVLTSDSFNRTEPLVLLGAPIIWKMGASRKSGKWRRREAQPWNSKKVPGFRNLVQLETASKISWSSPEQLTATKLVAMATSKSTFRWNILVIFQPERSLAVDDFLADDGKAVDVAFLCSFRRRIRQSQQFRRRPQFGWNKKVRL